MNDEKHISVWNACLEIIGNNLEPQQFATWFKPIVPVSLIENALTVEVPTHFFPEYIEAKYLDLLSKTLHRVIGPDAKLFYKVRVVASQQPMILPLSAGVEPRNSATAIPSSTIAAKPGAMVFPGIQRVEINPQLNPIYSFSNLVEGACNKLGITAGHSIAQNPGNTAFNPLFIFGTSGLGKTHLAQAIGLEIKEKMPELTVLYVAANRFKTQYMNAVNVKNQLVDFLAFYQKIDVLIVDDIQELSSPGTQNAFFHIFNYLHQNNKQLIFTSDRPQVELQNFEKRLLSRLKWGLSIQLMAPDYNTRLKMLKARAEREGVKFDDSVLEFLAQNIRSNFRELEGALISIIANCTFLNTEPTVDIARRIISNLVTDDSEDMTVDKVEKTVCEYFNITIDDLVSPSRKRNIVQARQIAMYLSRNHTDSSLNTIGELIGGKDHATVLHACTTVSDLMSTNRTFKQYVQDIEKMLYA